MLEQRDLQILITVEMICQYAKAQVEAANCDLNFQASRNWAEHFMKRHNLVIRAGTSIAQKLPGDLETKINDFHTFVKKWRKEDEYEDCYILNMDETPAYFDTTPNKTVDLVSFVLFLMGKLSLQGANKYIKHAIKFKSCCFNISIKFNIDLYSNWLIY